MRIVVLVEGDTERAFFPALRRFLEPRLSGRMPKLESSLREAARRASDPEGQRSLGRRGGLPGAEGVHQHDPPALGGCAPAMTPPSTALCLAGNLCRKMRHAC